MKEIRRRRRKWQDRELREITENEDLVSRETKYEDVYEEDEEIKNSRDEEDDDG